MNTVEQEVRIADQSAETVLERRSLLGGWRLKGWQVSVLTVMALLAIWYLVCLFGLVSAVQLPSPQAVLQRIGPLMSEGYMDATLLEHTTASLGRIVLALVLAAATAIPLGIAIGSHSLLRAVFDPLIEFYRPIPPLAYLPLLVIWFGIGEFPKVLLIYLAIFAPLAITVRDAVLHVSRSRLQAARSLGASRTQQVLLVTLPTVLPDIFKGLRIGLGVGWSTLVAAELVAATQGLGFMVKTSSDYLQTDVVIAGIVIIALLASLSELLLRWLQRRLVPWQAHG